VFKSKCIANKSRGEVVLFFPSTGVCWGVGEDETMTGRPNKGRKKRENGRESKK